ncbi:MAG: cadherin-like beta sandwich domain-containing protein [Spirochaetales bacterium]|nr:cadherin-like beta sandwich domain-containing protein [Spirochaetales bacterium]
MTKRANFNRAILMILVSLVLVLASCSKVAETSRASNDASFTSIVLLVGGSQSNGQFVGGTPVPFTPSFDPDVTSYAAQVPAGTTQLHFTGTLSSDLAHFGLNSLSGVAADGITTLGVSLLLPSQVVQFDQLQTGANTLRARVVAEDGVTEKVYTLTVTVAP